ncbi:hypothetical protein [Rubritalea tangerina]|uniref:hypothetical protein n=1 Tax=Rubritalea tangerina TaxID=430798 RepID=UPI0036130917
MPEPWVTVCTISTTTSIPSVPTDSTRIARHFPIDRAPRPFLAQPRLAAAPGLRAQPRRG